MVSSATHRSPRQHLLTIALEDYYHVGAFNQLIQRRQWYRFERRLEQSTRATLDLLDEHGQRATFFVLGWVAEHLPEVVRGVVERGHEVASKGYYHRGIGQMTPEEFRDDLARARAAIERAGGRRVLGYRVADRWFGPADLWALDVLAEQGYAYDSSIAPMLRAYAAEPWRRFAHTHRSEARLIWEFPISAADVLGFDVPIAGGNWFRQLPHPLVRRAVARWDRECPAPFVMYFHTWELDPEQPKIAAAPWLQRVRQYRNLERMPAILRHYLRNYRFTSIAAHLRLDTALTATAAPVAELPHSGPRLRVSESFPAPAGGAVAAAVAAAVADEPGERLPITVVVPCYNEESVLPYLANTLASVQRQLGRRYDLRFVFVDDASTDGTWPALERIFGDRDDCRLLRHEVNRGVAAGIMTGLRHASTEVVCSIDCDCTYDPHELGRMIPMLRAGVDLVTASPYHPEGRVHNVPGWRLFLSRGLSALYRLLLRHKLHTYTSCFRVYRRSAVVGLELEYAGFLGVAETVARMDLGGARIVECPTTLEVRVLGRSKMKVARTIAGHLGLLARMIELRLDPGRAPLTHMPAVSAAPAAADDDAPHEPLRA